MSTAKKEPGLAMLVIVLALICLVVAALLGLVNQVTAPAIAANTEKTIQDSLKVVLPADSYEKVEYDGGDITQMCIRDRLRGDVRQRSIESKPQ